MPMAARRLLVLPLLLLGRQQGASAISAQTCAAGVVEQQWTLSESVAPGDSKLTNVQMSSPKGGCWEITGCDTKDGASVGCGYGCKPLPSSCTSLCDCNGAWSTNGNGTITSVMDVRTSMLAASHPCRLTAAFCGTAGGISLSLSLQRIVCASASVGQVPADQQHIGRGCWHLHRQAKPEVHFQKEREQLHSLAGQALHPGRAAARAAAHSLPEARQPDGLRRGRRQARESPLRVERHHLALPAPAAAAAAAAMR